MRGCEIGLYNQTMSFLRYSSLAFLISALVSVFLVARTLFLSPALLFLIFLLIYLRALRLGFFLPITLSLLNLWMGSYLTKYCWLSQARQKPEDLFPPKAVLNPNKTMFLGYQWYLLAISSLRSFCDTLGLPSWYTSSSSSFLASSLLTRSLLVLIVTAAIKNNIYFKYQQYSFPSQPPPPRPQPSPLSLLFSPQHSPHFFYFYTHQKRSPLQTPQTRYKFQEFYILIFLIIFLLNKTMSYQFLLMRHARSLHNKEKEQWKQRYNDKSYKLLPQYRLSKYSTQLIDSSEVDIQQCLLARNLQPDLQLIDLVICSPLRRCLQTCKYLTQGREIKVIVEPTLCSRIAAAWSISSSADKLEQQYPDFDFSLLRQASEDWMLQLVSSYSPSLIPNQNEPKGSSVQSHLLNLLQQGHCESYTHFFERTRTLKKRLCKILSTHLAPTQKQKKILIISHSCVLSFLLGSQLTENGKVKDKISFEHCQPKKFTYQDVIRGKISPSL